MPTFVFVADDDGKLYLLFGQDFISNWKRKVHLFLSLLEFFPHSNKLTQACEN